MWDRNNSLCFVASLSLLRLFSAPPSLAISLSLSPSLPFSLSRSLSQEDLKYQYPFLLDIAFSLQSAFCCPFIVKTSGEIPCRNILSNAALPASNDWCAAPHRPIGPLAKSFGEKGAYARTDTYKARTHSCPHTQVIVPVFQEQQQSKQGLISTSTTPGGNSIFGELG